MNTASCYPGLISILVNALENTEAITMFYIKGVVVVIVLLFNISRVIK